MRRGAFFILFLFVSLSASLSQSFQAKELATYRIMAVESQTEIVPLYGALTLWEADSIRFFTFVTQRDQKQKIFIKSEFRHGNNTTYYVNPVICDFTDAIIKDEKPEITIYKDVVSNQASILEFTLCKGVIRYLLFTQ